MSFAVLTNQKNLVTRFAPAPTGELHLGHIAAAIYVWGIARAVNAKIILRIEDHDRQRCRKNYEEAILRDLEWFGFIPDLGVESADKVSPFRQSDHLESYAANLAKLAEKKLIYYCDCSRQSIARESVQTDGDELHYPGLCRTRGLKADAGLGTRLMVESQEIPFTDICLGAQQQNPAHQCGDFLLRDRRANWTYQFAVTVDDREQGVNLVIRGQDLLASTGRQLYLNQLLGASQKRFYYHHPLIFDESGKKLSKRLFSSPVALRKGAGESAASLLAGAAKAVGLIKPNVAKITVKDLPDIFLNLVT